MRGEPERIQRAVSNLVDNAVKWSPRDGTIEIDLADGALSVRDHGPGFEAADIPHVFDRFYRAPGARSLPGSGLGLSLALAVAHLHGGELRLEDNGPGLKATLDLPRSGPQLPQPNE